MPGTHFQHRSALCAMVMWCKSTALTFGQSKYSALRCQSCWGAYAVVQVSTVAGWSKIFYLSTDNTNISSLAYFLGIIVCVAYILTNLFLAGSAPLLGITNLM